MQKDKTTITLTFSENIENHVGMQQIGEKSKNGFMVSELEKMAEELDLESTTNEMINLNKFLPKGIEKQKKARILIIRKFVQGIFGDTNNIFDEQANLDVDKKAFMYGRVVNKTARYNLCFADFEQEPDYESKKGRVVSFESVPYTNRLREMIGKYIGDKAENLFAEGNYYYDTTKTGIGFHGDGERKKVIGVRLGQSSPLHFQWFYKGEPVGKMCKLMLNDGDLYVMSEKTTGNDWKKKNIYTLRHSAGSNKYTTLKVKK